MRIDVTAGEPGPLGAHWTERGVSFAVRSGVASRIEVCLFESGAPLIELVRFELPGRRGDTFYGFVSSLAPGLLYGLRVHGPWCPERGQRCDPSKLLLDPYARAAFGELIWNESTRGSEPASEGQLAPHDSAAFVPRAVIVDTAFDWAGDRRPETPWSQTLIYELHVRGFSRQNLAVPEALRGSYAGLAHPASIAHLQELGVTAVELLPVHELVDDAFLVERGLCNFWGYSTLSFFAPARRYSADPRPGAVLREFKQMVQALHTAGIEVLLDVVYNHTCEGGADGPTLSLKGVDHGGYYALLPDGRARDVTGCGNSLNAASPLTADLIIESLRYWVDELHVDGFRFDLATTLGRDESGAFSAQAALLARITQDPLLSRCKLIAEPWDLGPAGYQLGSFPAPLSEWNDRFRDAARRYWRGVDVSLRELSLRLGGSPDLFAAAGRAPQASINFVTAHDGFTLHDLVSYEHKHNEANGEQNRDGSSHNESSNHGVEGPSDDPQVQRAREQHKRNLLATLLLSRGVPMLLAGDELGRTQRGNNNAYCQDSEISWLDHQLDAPRRELQSFCRALIALRKRLPLLAETSFGVDRSGQGARFHAADGRALEVSDAAAPSCFGFEQALEGTRLLVLFNRGEQAQLFVLPERGEPWQLALATDLQGPPVLTGHTLLLAGCSLAVLT